MSDSVEKKMIFVVGNSRSGTTLMGSILGNGPEVFTFEELHFFDLPSSESPLSELSAEKATALAAKLFSIQADNFLTPKDPALFSQEAKTVVLQSHHKPLTPASIFENFLRFTSRENKKTVPCEQTPQNVFHIQELLAIYPQCQIINMVRDPRDVLLSQKYKWKIRFLGASNISRFEAFRSWSNYHPVVISKLWNSAIQAAQQFEDHPRVQTIRFEDLILDPESVVRNVCRFAGVAFSPEMLNVSQGEGGVSSHKKVSPSARGIDSGVISKWKNGGLLTAEVYICQAITCHNMAQYSYEPISVNTTSRLLSTILFLFLPFKLTLAVLLNLKRIGNLRETIKKRVFA